MFYLISSALLFIELYFKLFFSSAKKYTKCFSGENVLKKIREEKKMFTLNITAYYINKLLIWITFPEWAIHETELLIRRTETSCLFPVYYCACQ